MNCNDVQRAVMESAGELPAAVQDHLRGCAPCRDHARLCAVLLSAEETPAPAAALDRAVREAAHRRLRRPRWRVLLPWRRPGLVAAAAAVVLVAVIAGLTRVAPERPGGSVARMAGQVTARIHTWASADVELAAIEGGLDAMVAELGDTGPVADLQEGASAGAENWDPLTELEFDLYFESQDLQETDG